MFPDQSAPEEIEVHWAAVSATQLIYRSDSPEKRMNNFWQILPQLKEKYKALWDTQNLPPIMRSRFGARNIENAESQPDQLSIATFTSKTMVPTSFLISMLIWGIQRSRRPAEDVARTCGNFRALWSLTFSIIEQFKCRVVRDDGATFAFMIKPLNQTPFLKCMFSPEYEQQVAADWKMKFSSQSCPDWMSSDNIYQASVLDVIMFMISPWHGRAYDSIIGVVHMVIRCFSKSVDKMGRTAKMSQVAEKSTYKNRKVFAETIMKRKAQCAEFLLRENDYSQQ